MTQQPYEKQGTGTPRRATGPVIAFRCPNGHPLHVDAQLAGKRGRCPYCKTPMTIPIPPGGLPAAKPPSGNPPASEPASDPLVANLPAGDLLESHSLNDLVSVTGAGPAELPMLELEPAAAEMESSRPEALPSQAEADEAPWHPTADLVARLWAEREHGGKVEVHHDDGVIVPDWYDVTWSRGTHGVFGSQATDGTVTITAVAWSAVQKVIVRQVQTLPADMFPTG